MTRQSWLDDDSQLPRIDEYAQQLGSFIDAMADGKVDQKEIDAQEARVARLMQQLEPQLDDQTHAQVTQLLCELTAYNLMQILGSMNEARPTTQFRG